MERNVQNARAGAKYRQNTTNARNVMKSFRMHGFRITCLPRQESAGGGWWVAKVNASTGQIDGVRHYELQTSALLDYRERVRSLSAKNIISIRG